MRNTVQCQSDYVKNIQLRESGKCQSEAKDEIYSTKLYGGLSSPKAGGNQIETRNRMASDGGIYMCQHMANR